jgi:hypothetical protein
VNKLSSFKDKEQKGLFLFDVLRASFDELLFRFGSLFPRVVSPVPPGVVGQRRMDALQRGARWQCLTQDLVIGVSVAVMGGWRDT